MRALMIASVLALASAIGFHPWSAAADSARAEGAPATAASDVSSQNVRPGRARTRITVTPTPRSGRFVRECDFRLVREVRAAGTYIVPRQNCWWTRQR